MKSICYIHHRQRQYYKQDQIEHKSQIKDIIDNHKSQYCKKVMHTECKTTLGCLDRSLSFQNNKKLSKSQKQGNCKYWNKSNCQDNDYQCIVQDIHRKQSPYHNQKHTHLKKSRHPIVLKHWEKFKNSLGKRSRTAFFSRVKIINDRCITNRWQK